MLKIHTILADGQIIHPDVMRGILKQNILCCLVPITSKGVDVKGRHDIKEKSKARNWNKVREIANTPIIFGMDSDVILKHTNIIRMMKNLISHYDAVVVPTKPDKEKGHGLFCIWKHHFHQLRVVKNECCMCNAIKNLNVGVIKLTQTEWR